MKKYFFVEILCIVLTVCFIVFSVAGTSVKTEKTAEEIINSLVELMSTEDIGSKNSNFTADKYNIDSSVFSSLECYCSDDVMNVNELFIGVFAEENDDAVYSAFEKYASDRFTLYDGYASEQSALIGGHILKVESGVLFFCIDENAEDIYEELLKII